MRPLKEAVKTVTFAALYQRKSVKQRDMATKKCVNVVRQRLKGVRMVTNLKMRFEK